MTTLAKRLNQLMRDKGVSNAELARMCHVSRPTVGGWLSGDIKEIKRSNLERICFALSCDIDWLLDGKEPQHKEANQAAQQAEQQGWFQQSFDMLLEDQQEKIQKIVQDMILDNERKFEQLKAKLGK